MSLANALPDRKRKILTINIYEYIQIQGDSRATVRTYGVVTTYLGHKKINI